MKWERSPRFASFTTPTMGFALLLLPPAALGAAPGPHNKAGDS